MGKFLIVLIVLVSIALVGALALLVLANSAKKKRLHKLKSSKRRGEDYIPRLLKIEFDGGRVIRKPVLPRQTQNGTFENVETDLLYICEGGIIIMALCGLPGAVDNPAHGTWTVTSPAGVSSFPDMLDSTKGVQDAIVGILREEKLYNIPIYNVAVFYGRKNTIRNASERVLTSEGLVEALKSVNSQKMLKSSDISDVCAAIKKNIIKQAQ